MERPPRDDEHARKLFWIESLDRPEHSRDDVVHNAAQALVLRDAHIVRLERLLEESRPERSRS